MLVRELIELLKVVDQEAEIHLTAGYQYDPDDKIGNQGLPLHNDPVTVIEHSKGHVFVLSN